MTRTANETIHSYVTDMLALENHISNALKGQIEDAEKSGPLLGAALRRFHSTTERHLGALKSLEDNSDAPLGVDVADMIKRAATTVAGLGAAAYDMLRSEKTPKNLRDDYTAFSLATIGYSMLYTTARALNEDRVATMAEAHLRDYTKMVMELSDLIPGSVVQLLREDGLTVDASVLAEIEQVVNSAWRQKA